MTSSPAPADKPPRRRRTSAAPPPGRGVRAGYSMRGLQGKVIDAIGRDIVGGKYAPESLLPKEADLTAAYGVSRTSVREAMKVLAAKGLIEIRQKIGTRVRARDLWNVFDSDVLTWHHQQGLSEAVMRDLIELRQVIEPAAARFASSRATMADLRRIERAQLAMSQHVTDPTGYAESDVEFHMAVFAASHNALLSRFGHLVADFLHMSFSVQQDAVTKSGADFTKDAEEHRRVFDAINRGEPDTAAAAMLNVILDGKRALSEAMETLSR
jgi:DNA-binding FadR family transcriptional regulator